jgi:arginine decarboxylase
MMIGDMQTPAARLRQPLSVSDQWTVTDASELYEVARWSKGYFSINDAGHLQVHPTKDPARAIDLKQLADDLQARGITLPLLIRFRDILKHRLADIHDAFQSAITQHQYTGRYHCVYPIKVNQQRQVVEEVLAFGEPYQFGLEAGSQARAARRDGDGGRHETPIICNGFKDAEFIEMAMLAQKIGRNVIPVVEKYTELELILEVRREGRRAADDRHAREARRARRRALAVVGRLPLEVRPDGRRDPEGLEELKAPRDGRLLQAAALPSRQPDPEHPHRQGGAERGGAHLRELVKARRGARVPRRRRRAGRRLRRLADQLRVEHELHAAGIRQRRRLPHPDGVRRGGRAAPDIIIGERPRGGGVPQRAHLQRARRVGLRARQRCPDGGAGDELEQPLVDLSETFKNVNARNALESYHDAQQALDMALNLFTAATCRSSSALYAERLFWAICRKLQRLTQQMDDVPEDLQGLDETLSDTYFCNFSLFQSMPDSWAIKQLFPVMPIHRLNERPTRHAVLGDITCDSDGKIDQFIDRRDVKKTLPLHTFNGEPYYLGVFLVGAYQEILGDLHNLFGDTHAVHVSLDEQGNVVLDEVVKGDTVREVLDYVEFDIGKLMKRLRTDVEAAVRDGKISFEQSGSCSGSTRTA